MRIFSVNYYRVLLALCALAVAGNVSTSAKTITDIPTHLLGEWDIVTANQWGREQRGMIALRKVPVHAWVEITREKIPVLGREPNSQTDFVDSEYEVTFSGSSTPHKINLQDLEGYWEVKGIFQSDYKSATVTFAWGGQPRPERFIDPTPENKYYSFELRRRQKSE
ncbi:MAG TPA: hypothetical protein DCW57_03155 [Planctomycetaceae bacterium]|nr:hypothetical protein [Planctomycetaceae bacterium]